jgi:hypothetical protein
MYLNTVRLFDTHSHLIWVTYYRRTHYKQSVCIINTITACLSTTSHDRPDKCFFKIGEHVSCIV